MEIRPARPEDSGALRELRLRAMADAPSAFGSDLERERARPPSFWDELAAGRRGLCLIAREDDVAVGMVGALDSGVVWGMWVAPEIRRHGVGRALLDAIEWWARDRGLDELRLQVNATEPGARALYEQAGFVPDGPDSLRRRL